MDRSEAPPMAADVACPARSECPAYFAGSSPARSASFFTTRATSMPDSRPTRTCPCRVIDRNSGPESHPHDLAAFRGAHHRLRGLCRSPSRTLRLLGQPEEFNRGVLKFLAKH